MRSLHDRIHRITSWLQGRGNQLVTGKEIHRLEFKPSGGGTDEGRGADIADILAGRNILRRISPHAMDPFENTKFGLTVHQSAAAIKEKVKPI